MGSFFLIMAISGSILFIINLAWFGWNVFLWVNNGIQFLLEGMNFAERLYESFLLKWILLTDFIYLLIIIISSLIRKSYKTSNTSYYLKHHPINNPKISISLNVYNEEQVVEKAVKDFISQKKC